MVLYHSQIRLCGKWTYNVHKYIYIEHKNPETRKTRNDFLVQVRNFLLPLNLKVLRHKERDTHSFYSGFFYLHPHLVRHLLKASASQLKSTLLVRCPVLNSPNWLFQKSPQSSARFRCMTSLALCNPVSYLGYCDISEWHVRSACARVNTCVNVAPK